ncbi:MAG: GIY-YIG nuclease family protein [Candidatus Moranbacteria bacterium]|nr:GIY-YIG nuclease family protein [Candidatus Moranbacteria bacterium]
MAIFIYQLISEDRTKTYIGFSDDLDRRISEHLAGKVKTTKNFGEFSHRILEKVNDIRLARIAEKYWKSASGRKKLKEQFDVE